MTEEDRVRLIALLEDVAYDLRMDIVFDQADEILCEALEYLCRDDLVKAYHSVQPKWYS